MNFSTIFFIDAPEHIKLVLGMIHIKNNILTPSLLPHNSLCMCFGFSLFTDHPFPIMITDVVLTEENAFDSKFFFILCECTL